MRIVLDYLKLKEDSNRLEILHWGHFAFVLLAMTLELFYGSSFINWAVTVALLIAFYRLFFVTKKELFYSFWTFSALLFLFLIKKILFDTYGTSEIRLLYFLGLILLLVEAYILSSPIYYPRVSWWEYDFRYRIDLKVLLNIKGVCSDARVTDLRRNAGCIASFEDLKVGSEFELESDKYFEGVLKVEIISKRIYSLGRPFSYGVRFNLEESEKRSTYYDLLNIWKNETLQRQQKKFRKKSKNA